MRVRRSTFLVLTIAFVCVAMATAALVQYRRQTLAGDSSLPTEQKINQLINDFRSSNKFEFSLKISHTWSQNTPKELFDANGILPDPDRYPREALNKILQAGEACQLSSVPNTQDQNIFKLQKWFEFKCGKSSSLDNSIWRKPPLIHPLGGSWVYWLYKNGYRDIDWLVQEKAFLHLLEFSDLPTSYIKQPLEVLLSDLTPSELQRLQSGAGFIASKNYILVTAYTGVEESVVHAFSRVAWNRFLLKQGFIMNSLENQECTTWRNYCWGISLKNIRTIDTQYFLLAMLVMVFALAGTLIFSLWKRTQEEELFLEKQQLVMQTLAHELRHPVTGLRLSMDSIRPHYDALPGEVMSDFLRVAAISERMSRLVKFSQQYLQLLARDREFAFQKNEFNSFHSFLETVLEDYQEKISLKHPGYDTACAIDGYWVSTCLVNLTVNALTYGQAPITVEWMRDGANLKISVQDAGAGPGMDLEQLARPLVKQSGSGGMGLGLSLVFRLAKLMNGSLDLQRSPTRFILTLNGVCHD